MESLNCYLDGDSLCIVKKDFINLQESDAVFIDLNEEEYEKIRELDGCDNRKHSDTFTDDNAFRPNCKDLSNWEPRE